MNATMRSNGNSNLDKEDIIQKLKRSHRKQNQRFRRTVWILIIITIVLSMAMLILGNTIYPIKTVVQVILGEEIKGATFALWQVRIPRLIAGILVGFSFGLSGHVFQTMLRNPLASPDMIGITSGSGVAAVICILIFHTSKSTASFAAIISGLFVAALIYLLSTIGGFSSGKLILIGIGIQAMTKAVISYILLKASQFDVAVAMRWLSGSLNGIQLKQIPMNGIAIVLLAIIVLFLGHKLRILELGEENAIALGLNTKIIRVILIVCCVGMIAFGTAITGPIACITFLSGPIAVKISGIGRFNGIPAGLLGVCIVLSSDIVGQYMLGTRFPVGVITGILGAPYLIYLLVSMNKGGKV